MTDMLKLIAAFCNVANTPNDVMLRRLMVFEAIHQWRAIILCCEPYHMLYRLGFVDHASLSASLLVYVLSLQMWSPHYVDSMVLRQEETLRHNFYLSMERISFDLNFNKLSGSA